MKAKKVIQKYWLWICIALIMIVAAILRFRCCFWGYPLHLGVDEGAIVDWTIDMLKRHSWEAHSYDRPDHFEIKCNAITFTIFSWLRYQKPAYEAFQEHKMAFVILARMYTSAFGVALIPLVSLYTGRLTKDFFEEKIRRIIQLFVAVLVAFSSIFVQHSALASPDIVLTFFVLLFAYQMMRYLENGNKRSLYLCMLVTGVGLTIKYPAAILSIPLAWMVIYRSIKIEKRPVDILKYGIISIGVILFTVFVLAPNLFTDFATVYRNFLEEARPTHLGQDGLGFFGNLKFYVKTITDDIGTVTHIPFVIGLGYLLLHPDRKWMSLLVGLTFWLCLSYLALHWLRWGIPMYPFFIIVVGIGIGACLRWINMLSFRKAAKALCECGAVTFLSLILFSAILSGFAVAKYCSLQDTRYTVRAYLDENGITDSNSISEGYTPFLPAQARQMHGAFVATKDGVKPKIAYATKRYFIMSNSFKDRYLRESERYPEQCRIYNGIEDTFEIVYRESPDGNYSVTSGVLKNIKNTWMYLRSAYSTTGEVITVYDMKTPYVTIASASGKYLTTTGDQKEAPIGLSDRVSQWVIYENDNDTKTLLSVGSGLALEVNGGEFVPETRAVLQTANGEQPQQWKIIEKDGFLYFVGGNNMALTHDEENVYLSAWTEAQNQRWIAN